MMFTTYDFGVVIAPPWMPSSDQIAGGEVTILPGFLGVVSEFCLEMRSPFWVWHLTFDGNFLAIPGF